jgi:hypothetical protein
VVDLICPTGKAKYFFKQGWTAARQANEVICPSGTSAGLVIARSDSDEAIHTCFVDRWIASSAALLAMTGKFVIPGSTLRAAPE